MLMKRIVEEVKEKQLFSFLSKLFFVALDIDRKSVV